MNNLLSQYIKVNVDLTKSIVIPTIKETSVQVLVATVLDKLVETVVVITDDSVDNKAQLKAIWANVTSNPEIVQALEQVLILGIEKMKDAKVQAAFTALVPEVIKTFVAVTDATPKDGEQIQKIWLDFVKSPAFVALVLTNIGLLLTALKLPEWLQIFFKSAKPTA